VCGHDAGGRLDCLAAECFHRPSPGAIDATAVRGELPRCGNPAGTTPIESADVLIALGERSRLKELEKMLEA
jgi:Trk K+ transport system NAD-binding subunit